MLQRLFTKLYQAIEWAESKGYWPPRWSYRDKGYAEEAIEDELGRPGPD